ncbi:uncharacterized protein LOC131165667 [Malania oleifera]|uniref:uncharacterized protein LOC131165667 n=1 Tax=Malania oleifera TaxID=397392 RepID=UPI0025ADDC3F|nr:uncharacterized protein LOC131165667 [Malania oleifera]
MTLLEVITKATANPEPPTSDSKHPFILNPDEIFINLKPQSEESDDIPLIKSLTGWQISRTDSELILSADKFFKKLKRNLKNPKTFNKESFLVLLNSFLENNRAKIGVPLVVDTSNESYTRVLIEKLGFSMGSHVARLVIEACVVLEFWEILETIVVNRLVEHSNYSSLVSNLVEKKRSDLLCLCIKHFADLRSHDLVLILKYFLSPSQDGYSGMSSVRKEWESQALLSIEKATDKSLKGKKLRLAKEAAVLLMIAYDEFSVYELCLHYLLSPMNVDEVILSSAIGMLNGFEMMGLIRYLGKWLRKYEKFPQAGPCAKASSVLGLKACEWVPRLEDIVKCIGLVVDEHFSSLVLHPEFHVELRSIEGVVNSLALEARLCCSMANMVENLKSGARDALV